MVLALQKLISLTIKSSVDNLNPSCWYPISDSSCEFHIMIPGMSSVRPSAFKRRHVLVQQYKGLLLALFKARAFAFLLWLLLAVRGPRLQNYMAVGTRGQGGRGVNRSTRPPILADLEAKIVPSH